MGQETKLPCSYKKLTDDSLQGLTWTASIQKIEIMTLAGKDSEKHEQQVEPRYKKTPVCWHVDVYLC